jgi:hypothetical protein
MFLYLFQRYAGMLIIQRANLTIFGLINLYFFKNSCISCDLLFM